MTFHERFCQFLQKKFPLLTRPEFHSASLSPLMVSSHVVRLPRTILTSVEQAVKGIWQIRNSKSYVSQIQTQAPELLHYNPGNSSILMSYDFHLDAALQPKLIEINTNAAFSLLAESLREFQNLPPMTPQGFEHELRTSLQNELQLSGRDLLPRLCAIVDEHPTEQKLFIEFVLFKNLFEKWGWPTQILDTQDLKWDGHQLTANKFPVDLIYNRDTDFLLQSREKAGLRAAYLQGKICLTPNPHEYLLLAEKQRLIEMANSEPAKAVQEALIRTYDLALYQDRRSEIWAQRKGLFFKPKASYGAKAAYRGSSISRKTFDETVNEHFVAQEYVPAPETEVELEDGSRSTFKYDLRFYVYQDQVQLACARLYQGQVTNFSHPGGGFSTVIFE